MSDPNLDKAKKHADIAEQHLENLGQYTMAQAAFAVQQAQCHVLLALYYTLTAPLQESKKR